MQTQTHGEGFSIFDLEMNRISLEGRIKKLEADLKEPMVAAFNEPAPQVSQQIILRRLIEVERNYLGKVNYELELRKQAVGTV